MAQAQFQDTEVLTYEEWYDTHFIAINVAYKEEKTDRDFDCWLIDKYDEYVVNATR